VVKAVAVVIVLAVVMVVPEVARTYGGARRLLIGGLSWV